MHVPQPVIEDAGNRAGIIAFGTTHHAVVEGRDVLRESGIETDYLRVRALPLSAYIAAFVERHERVYVIEQNRDGQLYSILRTELAAHLIERLRSIRHYNGVPIDASAVVDPILAAEETLFV
jgi:2-oxoglutarate ferredoxin oxidoreductase subunit alpha